VGGSEGDLLKLGALAGVGACVASCLDDADLRVACGALAHDARWWRGAAPTVGSPDVSGTLVAVTVMTVERTGWVAPGPPRGRLTRSMLD
jgi:hypothetical protein